MNPVTRSLLHQVNDRRLIDFVENWDALEALVIRVYKGKGAAGEDRHEHRRLRGVLVRQYAQWQAGLARHWPEARLAGEPAREDPFAALLAVENAQDYAGNWRAMQTLPAAREALNRFLIEKIEGLSSGGERR